MSLRKSLDGNEDYNESMKKILKLMSLDIQPAFSPFHEFGEIASDLARTTELKTSDKRPYQANLSSVLFQPISSKPNVELENLDIDELISRTNQPD